MKGYGLILEPYEEKKIIPKNQIATLTSLVKDLGKEVEIIKSRDLDHETKSDGSPLSEADKFVNENFSSNASLGRPK